MVIWNEPVYTSIPYIIHSSIMCVGFTRGPSEYEKTLTLPGVVVWDEETFYPEHDNTLNSSRGRSAGAYRKNYLIMTFMCITMAFYAFFKVVVLSITELREAVFVFVVSFAIGFITATRANR